MVHDVLVTLGFVAISAYFVNGAGSLASLLLVDKFQINLTLVAAFLTIIGYSLNDTIVIFNQIFVQRAAAAVLVLGLFGLGWWLFPMGEEQVQGRPLYGSGD